MQDQPTPDSYEWPTCAAGPTTGPHAHRLWDTELDRLVCRPCEARTAKRITEIPRLFQQLNTTSALMRGARTTGTGGSSGTKTPPIPPRLEVLALVGPGGIATRLQAIEDSWRNALGWTLENHSDGVRVFASWRSDPARAVPAHAQFLTNNLLWACSSYESIGQDINEIRILHTRCTDIVDHKQKPGSVKIGHCPVLTGNQRCGEQLYASTRTFKTTCSTCGTVWEGAQEWRKLRSAQQQALTELVGGIAA